MQKVRMHKINFFRCKRIMKFWSCHILKFRTIHFNTSVDRVWDGTEINYTLYKEHLHGTDANALNCL